MTLQPVRIEFPEPNKPAFEIALSDPETGDSRRFGNTTDIELQMMDGSIIRIGFKDLVTDDLLERIRFDENGVSVPDQFTPETPILARITHLYMVESIRLVRKAEGDDDSHPDQ